MSLFDIVEYPNDILGVSCDNAIINPELVDLSVKMAETMYAFNGVGLAAPQIGVTSRILVMDPSAGESGNQLMVLINPEVTWRSPEQKLGPEGCLSLPGVEIAVPRSVAIEVKYFDIEGKERIERLTQWAARIAQHELDHLDGIMMFDRVGRLQRKLALKNLGKNR